MFAHPERSAALRGPARSAPPPRSQIGGLGKIGDAAKRMQQFQDVQMTDAEEQQLGAAVSEKIRTRYGVVQNPAVHRYVGLVGSVLASQGTRPGLAWKFIVLDTDGVNAYAAPGGYVHVTRGALSLMKDESELAGVLAHEIVHITEKHTIRAIQKGKVIQMGADETLSNSPALFERLVESATDAVLEGFGRATSCRVTAKGIALANKVGYAPQGLGNFLTTLQGAQQGLDGEEGPVRVASGDEGAARQAGQGDRRGEAGLHRHRRRPLHDVDHLQAGADHRDHHGGRRCRRPGRGHRQAAREEGRASRRRRASGCRRWPSRAAARRSRRRSPAPAQAAASTPSARPRVVTTRRSCR